MSNQQISDEEVELGWCRQILAADMSVEPSDAPLPAPTIPLMPGSVAFCLYDAIQELRALRRIRDNPGEAHCPACGEAKFVKLEENFGDGRTLPVKIDCPKCGAALVIRQHFSISEDW